MASVSDGSGLISHKRYSSGSTAVYKANFNRFMHERTYVDFMLVRRVGSYPTFMVMTPLFRLSISKPLPDVFSTSVTFDRRPLLTSELSRQAVIRA